MPPGLGNIPPGQLKEFEAGFYSVYSPDDYFDDAIDDLVEDSFEENYDGMYKDSKAKEKKEFEEKVRGAANAEGNIDGGNPSCNDEGITDNDPTKTSGQVGEAYVVEDFTGVGSDCAIIDPSNIDIQVSGPGAGILELNQGDSFTPDVKGTWTITAKEGGQFSSPREVIVTGGPDAGPDQIVSETCSNITLDGSGSTVPAGRTIASYSWIKVPAPQGEFYFPEFPSTPVDGIRTFLTKDVVEDTTYTFTLTITDDLTNQYSDSVAITITDGTTCPGGGNTTPDAGVDIAFSVSDETPLVVLDGTGATDTEDDAADPVVPLTYLWTKTGGPGGPDSPVIVIPSDISPTFTAPTINGPDQTVTIVLEFTLRVTDSGGLFDEKTVTVTVTNSG